MKLKPQTIKEVVQYLQSLLPAPVHKKIPAKHVQVRNRFGLDGESAPSTKAFRSAGASFFCGYLSYEGNPKNIKWATVKRLRRDKISLVAVFETTATRAGSGRIAGREDARSAIAQLKKLGAPSDAVVYFAVDYEANPMEVAGYFDGVKDVLGKHRCGAYGDYRVLKFLFDTRRIGFGWQTYAWSGKARETRAQLYQFSNGHSVGGVEVDFDRSYGEDFGQW